MILLSVLMMLAQQDTNTTLSPRVGAMIDRFPPPRGGVPSIAVRFSRDTVWLGEQVELVTAMWFPRPLRDQLRRSPNVSPPSVPGVWSARNQQQPVHAESRVFDHQLYDLYISYQTIFPLGAGRVTATPAVLAYGLPTSTSYFAPEERKTFASAPAVLEVRAIPTAVAATIGPGPTAHALHIAWRGPVAALHVGTPAIVELVVSGEGNLTLWPIPRVDWPPGAHVYPEPTEEHTVAVQGTIAGEKRFRFTVVSDSAGVTTLPVVRYSYFDPGDLTAHVATAAPFELPVLPRSGATADRQPPALARSGDVPWATTLVRVWWPTLLVLVLGAPLVAAPRRRRRKPTSAAPPSTPELALRVALGAPVDAGPDHVVAALRLRGVPRHDAEHIHRWLSATARRRYGSQPADAPDPPPVVERVLARLRQVATLVAIALLAMPLHSQTEDGSSRYHSGDYDGAVRVFEQVAERAPLDVGAWHNLGAARWMQGDDVHAAAAWLHGLRLAPRNPALEADWAALPAVPTDVRSLAPGLALSRDEILLIALLAWCVVWLGVGLRWVRMAWCATAVCALMLAWGLARARDERSASGLMSANTALRISPHPATTAEAELPIWSEVHIARREGGWFLVETTVASPAIGLANSVAGWVPASSVAVIGLLD